MYPSERELGEQAGLFWNVGTSLMDECRTVGSSATMRHGIILIAIVRHGY